MSSEIALPAPSARPAFQVKADGWLGVLIWLPTLQSMPQAGFGMALLWALFRARSMPRVPTIDIVFLITIIAASSLNFLYGLGATPDGHTSRNPYFIAYVATYFVARVVTRADLRAVLYAVAFETLFVYLEFLLHVNTFFTWNPEYRAHMTATMLYFTRPFGLSDASSVIGYKILLALLLLDYTEVGGKTRRILQLILLPAFVLVFNRTAILAYVAYLIYCWASDRLRRGLKWRDLFFGAAAGTGIFFVPDSVVQILWSQINRDKTTGVDLSYRDVIWADFLRFFEHAPLLGNGSSKYYALLPAYGTFEHAHNSYLELLASNGAIISALYLLWLVMRAKPQRFRYILAILLYSFSQYGFFWGISFVDIVFLSIVIFDVSKKRGETGADDAPALIESRA